jgi:hypothetical protein
VLEAGCLCLSEPQSSSTIRRPGKQRLLQQSRFYPDRVCAKSRPEQKSVTDNSVCPAHPTRLWAVLCTNIGASARKDARRHRFHPPKGGQITSSNRWPLLLLLERVDGAALPDATFEDDPLPPISHLLTYGYD